MLYLVGSRFYQLHRPDSDWDFLGKDDEDTRQFCELIGLKRLENSKHVRYFIQNIDVCLVKNLEARLYARDTLLTLDFKSMDKGQRHIKIRELVDAYELGRPV